MSYKTRLNNTKIIAAALFSGAAVDNNGVITMNTYKVNHGKRDVNTDSKKRPVIITGLKVKVYDDPYVNKGSVRTGEIMEVIHSFYVGKIKLYRAKVKFEGMEDSDDLEVCVFPYRNIIKKPGREEKFKYGVS